MVSHQCKDGGTDEAVNQLSAKLMFQVVDEVGSLSEVGTIRPGSASPEQVTEELQDCRIGILVIKRSRLNKIQDFINITL